MATSADYLRDLTQLGYSFRYNEVTDRVEVNGESITDVLSAKIRAEMRDRRHKSMTAVEDAYLADAWTNRYHPIHDYFAGLVWDGGEHIAKLATYFTDKHDVFPLYLRKWLIGAVAKLYEREARTFMLVLDGEQYIGKSRFARWLCPLRSYFIEGPLNVNDKDTWTRLTTKFIWELSELDATTRKSDRAALKDFVTKHEVTVRRPYDRFDMMKPVIASLIGSINEEGSGFLNDPTGNTRFAVVALLAIDNGYAADLAIDQVWAEAYTAYQAGEAWELTTAERARQAEINAEYEGEPTIEGMIHKYYNLDPDLDEWTSGIDIILELETYGLKEQQRSSLMQLANLMKKFGHERKRIRRVWSYKGITRKPPAGVIP